ncbi:hypothetical protein [Vreelandella arctica]|uniref:hypothetical protein n=1 Tax=Vreelandella arctica TaxID=3126499 RepID=UPI00300E6485
MELTEKVSETLKNFQCSDEELGLLRSGMEKLNLNILSKVPSIDATTEHDSEPATYLYLGNLSNK